MIIERSVIEKVLEKHNLIANKECQYCNGAGYSKWSDTVCHCVIKKQPPYYKNIIAFPSRKSVKQIMEELRAYHRNQKRS